MGEKEALLGRLEKIVGLYAYRAECSRILDSIPREAAQKLRDLGYKGVKSSSDEILKYWLDVLLKAKELGAEIDPKKVQQSVLEKGYISESIDPLEKARELGVEIDLQKLTSEAYQQLEKNTHYIFFVYNLKKLVRAREWGAEIDTKFVQEKVSESVNHFLADFIATSSKGSASHGFEAMELAAKLGIEISIDDIVDRFKSILVEQIRKRESSEPN